MIYVYGIKNCDTCRKALKWLKAEGIEHSWHDVRDHPLHAETIETWIKAIGLEALVNKRSTSYRGLTEAQKQQLQQGEDVVELLLEIPTLLKRPIFEKDEHIFSGFKAAEQETLKRLSQD